MPQPASRRRRLIAFLVLLVAVFLALGTWQVERLSWKLDLIARVEARIHAAPVPAPLRNEWGGVNARDDEVARLLPKVVA